MKQSRYGIRAISVLLVWMLVGVSFVGMLNVVEEAEASGFNMDLLLKDADVQFWGEDGGDYSGYSVASAGDVNGDGYDDILIGAYGDEDGGGNFAGQTYLILGSAAGWPKYNILTNADASFIGEDNNDYSGFCVASAGDVNGDGYDDILIGAYMDEDFGGLGGQTYLILGKPSGWTMDNDLSQADASFIGEAINDYSGYSVAGAGDVNGDGYGDIIIGAYGSNEGGSEAGQAYLVFGRAAGWSSHTSLADSDASFIGEDDGDFAGCSVAGCGDVNGDGYNDILIGAYGDEEGGGNEAGQTYLILGKATGWTMDINLSQADASFLGEGATYKSGRSVAGADDVNGDGLDDILIGAYEDDEGGNYAGQAYLILGQEMNWSMDFSLTNADASFIGEDQTDYAGYSVSGAGDVNGDGYDDILIGANGNEEGGGSNVGQSYLILGKASGWTNDVDLGSVDASFIGEAVVDNSGRSVAGAGDVNGDGYDDILIGALLNDSTAGDAGKTYLLFYDTRPPAPRFLEASLASDGGSITVSWEIPRYIKPFSEFILYRSVDGTNYVEVDTTPVLRRTYIDSNVILGETYYYSVIAVDGSGERSVMSSAISMTCDSDLDEDGVGNTLDTDDDGDGIPDMFDANLVAQDGTLWSRSRVSLSDIGMGFLGESEDDLSGNSVAIAGDVNGDGYDDILIGAWLNDELDIGAGQAYLIFGKSSGWDSNLSLSLADASFTGEDFDDRAGWKVAGAGDVNGDGFDDILISAYRDEEGGTQAGQTYLILGKEYGWSQDISLSNADASFIGEYAADTSGESIAGVGDVNGDGFDDILIGAIRNDGGGNSAGQAYLILGKASGWTMDVNLSLSDASFQGEDEGDNVGHAVAGAGDVNGDGYDDMLINALYDEEGGADAGQTYLIFGKPAGWTMYTNLSNADASFIGEAASDHSGWSVAGAGDVNGDGFDDILIGAADNDYGSTKAGQSYIIFGKSSGWSNDTNLSQADASFIGEGPSDWSGNSVAGCGDVNGDGYDDILIGAFGDNDGGGNAGQSYLILGRDTGWTMRTHLSKADASFIGELGGDNSGRPVAGGGDINGDGFDDILIGADGNDEGSDKAGKTYLIVRTFGQQVTNLTLNLASELGGIHLSWDDDTVEPWWSFGVYRGAGPNSLSRLALLHESAYTDFNITLGATYYYAVTLVCPLGGESPMSDQQWLLADIDTDSDGIGNAFDYDDDGDGINDYSDAFPLNSSEWLDTDLDGIGNEADTDDDNDGVLDVNDPEPLNPLNDLGSKIDYLNTTVNDIQNRVIDIQSDLDSMNTSLGDLQDDIADLNQTLPLKMDNLASQLADVNNSLLSRISDSENNILAEIADLNDTNILNFLQGMNESLTADISNLLSSITNDIIALDSSLSDKLTGLLDNITTNDDALRTWLEIVLAAIDTNLTDTKSTLQDQLNDLDAYVAGFNDTLRSDISGISSTLLLHDENTGENHTEIQNMLDNLLDDVGAIELEELKIMLTNLAENVSLYNESIAQDIEDVVDDIGYFEDEAGQRLNAINDTLDDLAKLDTLLTDLGDLDTDLQTAEDEIQASIDEIPDDKKEEEEFGMAEGLLIVVLVLLIINLLVMLMGRGKASGAKVESLKEPETQSVELEEEPVEQESEEIAPEE